MIKDNSACLLILGVCLFICSQLHAQTSDRPLWLSVNIGHNEYKGDLENEFLKFDLSEGFTAGMSLSAYLNSSFDLSLDFNTGVLDGQKKYSDRTDYFRNRIVKSGLLGRYKFANGYILKKDSGVQPYIKAGIGVTSYFGGKNDAYINRIYYNVRDGRSITIPLGIGFEFPLSSNISLYEESVYHRTFAEGFDNKNMLDGLDHDDYFIHSVGVKIALFGSDDKDHDGVSDKMDVCPDEKGLQDLNGCPDQDGDGVADRSDRCPQVAGADYLNGCPDSDGDRVADKQDECPAVAGESTLKGCPDDDGDKVINKIDECPDKAGDTATGCPDSDGDKVEDRRDECPDVPGLMDLNGCPDTDGDGIADAKDQCPKQAGVAQRQGCPVTVTEDLTQEVSAIADSIKFNSGKSDITQKVHEDLLRLTQIMQQDPNLHLIISAYTDSEGPASYNWQLSKKRAIAIKQFLVKQGISEDRLKAEGYGEISPIATNDTPEGREKNRRIELELTYF